MSDKKNVHVVPHPEGGWATKREQGDRASSRHPTQSEAIDRGREIARNNQVDVVIHGRDGRIRGGDSHGNDPFPPRDRK